MLKIVKKRKRVDPFKHQILRDVIRKGEAHEMTDVFEEKYKELKIEGKREKNTGSILHDIRKSIETEISKVSIKREI